MSEPMEFEGAAPEGAMRSLLLSANRPEALGIRMDALEPMPPEVEYSLRPLLRSPFGYARKKTRPVWRQMLHTAACIAVALTVTLGGLLAVSPNARAMARELWNMVVEWTHESASYYFTGTQDTPIGVWRLDGVPEGFVEISQFDAGEAQLTRYEKDAWYRLEFTYLPTKEGYMFDFDNEHSNYSELILNGRTAYLFDSNTEDKMSSLIWFSEDGTVGFQLMGDFTGAELLEMAQTVVPEE